jgi:hypothetical protein
MGGTNPDPPVVLDRVSISAEVPDEVVAVLLVGRPPEDLLEDVEHSTNLMEVGQVDFRHVPIEGAPALSGPVPVSCLVA